MSKTLGDLVILTYLGQLLKLGQRWFLKLGQMSKNLGDLIEI